MRRDETLLPAPHRALLEAGQEHHAYGAERDLSHVGRNSSQCVDGQPVRGTNRATPLAKADLTHSAAQGRCRPPSGKSSLPPSSRRMPRAGALQSLIQPGNRRPRSPAGALVSLYSRRAVAKRTLWRAAWTGGPREHQTRVCGMGVEGRTEPISAPLRASFASLRSLAVRTPRRCLRLSTSESSRSTLSVAAYSASDRWSRGRADKSRGPYFDCRE